MEVISIRTFCRLTPFDRGQALLLVWWGILDTVTYDHRTLITMGSVEAVLERTQNWNEAISFEDFIATFCPTDKVRK